MKMIAVHFAAVSLAFCLATPALAADDAAPLAIHDFIAMPEVGATLPAPRLRRNTISELQRAQQVEGVVRFRDPFPTKPRSARPGEFVPGQEVFTDVGGTAAPGATASVQGLSPGWRGKGRPDIPENDRLYLQRRESVVGDSLPIWKEKLDERGIPFSLPFGVSMNFSWIEQLTEIRDLKIGVNGGDLKVIDDFLEVSPDSLATSIGARLDMWVFPFFNLFALIGHTRVKSDTTITLDRLLPNRPTVTVNLPLDRKGPTFGIGGVLAGGVDWFFGSFTFTRTITDFPGTSRIDVSVYSVRAGWRGDAPGGAKIAAWVGATYWDTERKLAGSATLDSGDTIDFELIQGPVTKWNPIIGFRYDYRGIAEFIIELGALEDRRSLFFGFTGRF